MYRQSPSNRNQRSKGMKVKYVLQICLLVAVCFWLIYQVKHSHDKKKEFEETDTKASLQRETSDEILKLGRKDIFRPRDDQTTSEIDEKHDEPIEEEDIVEEDENKPEEDEPEEKNVEEKENNNNNVKDEQENSDAEADRGEDSVDENDNEELASEDEHGQTERGIVAERTHEAREENYKADDASSAVTHDTNQTGGTEKENERTEYSNEHMENVLEEENKENNSEENITGEKRKDLEVGNSEIGIVDRKSNVTTGESKVDVMDGSENGSPPNNTITMEGSDGVLTSNNGSSEFKIENHDSSEAKPELDHDSQAIASTDDTDGFDSNSTGFVETKDAKLPSWDLSNSPNNNNNNNTESSSEKKDEMEIEESDITDGTYENSESTGTVNPEEEIQHDGVDESDASNSMEEKHVRTDLDTLPEIQTEGTNSDDDDVAA